MSLRGHYNTVLFKILCVCLVATWPSTVFAERISPSVPPSVADRLSRGIVQDLIVLFDDRAVEAEAANLRQRSRKDYDEANIRAFRHARYRSIKQSIAADGLLHDIEEIRDYDQLPMTLFRFRSRPALERFLADPRVQTIYEDRPIYPHLTYSLPFIAQPVVSGAGMSGNGVTVAVLDTGINYTLPTFGSCTAPGIPSGCRVAASVDVTGNNLTLNTAPGGHGTNVAGIAAGVAPGALIAAINVFSAGSSTTSWVIAGINWAIANKDLYDIAALNMSLGDGSKNTALCGKSATNPFVTPINNLRNAGIIPVASSGNNGYTNGISNPACIPGVVSVGAVYDLSWRSSPDPALPFTFSACTDTTLAAPDTIPCFSNSASFLTMLAPGAFITAAGIQMAGTSQAAPHVAGTVAVMRAAYPGDTLDQAVARLTSGGVSVTDIRNAVTKPRLNLAAGISPPSNDLFANGSVLTGDSGPITAHNLNAGKEAGEPNHAGNPGGKSVWFSWTPSLSGTASFDTHGSLINTLLAVYTGESPANLLEIAANDNDGSTGTTSDVTFTAQAGIEYFIAVDGFNGASGGITLDWSLAQQADLEITISQSPVSPFEGDNSTYTMIVTNHGPSSADGIVVTDILPAGVTFVSADQSCDRSGETVVCALGSLANNSSASIQLVVNTPVSGTLTNVAQVSSTTTDTQLANNSASLTMTVNQVAAVPALSPWGFGVAAVCLTWVAGSWNRRRNTD